MTKFLGRNYILAINNYPHAHQLHGGGKLATQINLYWIYIMILIF